VSHRLSRRPVILSLFRPTPQNLHIDDVQCSVDISDVTHPGLCAEEVIVGAAQTD